MKIGHSCNSRTHKFANIQKKNELTRLAHKKIVKKVAHRIYGQFSKSIAHKNFAIIFCTQIIGKNS